MYSVPVPQLVNYRYTVVQLRPKRSLLHRNNIQVYTPVQPMRNFFLSVRQIFQFQFWPHRRYWHVILGQLLRKYEIISLYQDGGRGRWMPFPVLHLLISLPSEGDLWSNQISSTYLNWWLRFNYFRFWKKTNVRHIGILLSVLISTTSRNFHVILYHATEFRPNLSSGCGNITSYPYLKMAAATAEYYFRFRICWCHCLQ